MTYEELVSLGEGAQVILRGRIDLREYNGDLAVINVIDGEDISVSILEGEYEGDIWWLCGDFHSVYPIGSVPVKKSGLTMFLEKTK